MANEYQTNVGSGQTSNPDPFATGGYGGGGGGSAPTPQQRQAAGNLGAITGYNQGTVLGDARNQDDIFDIADQQNKNLASMQTAQARRGAGNDWYTQQQRIQSVNSQLRDVMGNAANGSSLYDLWDLIARKDDMDDVAVLNQLRENRNQIDNNLFEAMAATNINRNQNAAETERALRELGGDYAAQMNNIHPDIDTGIYNQDGHTLNLPDWLRQTYYQDNRSAPLTASEAALIRPNRAAQTAWDEGLLTGQANMSQAANSDYANRMRQGYQRRTQ